MMVDVWNGEEKKKEKKRRYSGLYNKALEFLELQVRSLIRFSISVVEIKP